MLRAIDEVEAFFRQRDTLGIKPGLKRVQYLLKKTDHPERELKSIHVAGTNGKGSTIQFIQEALRANHLSVGVFTSPSFIGIGGHFFINGEPATDEEVIGLMNQLLPFIQELDDQGDAPTTFEIITVMAFCYFVHKVDIAVIETGMGGRFDTTNCFVPEVSVITNISMDHMQFLGASLPEIAWHKAGIIKDHVPVVLGNIEDPNSIKVFEKESKANQAEIYRLGHEFCYKREANNVSWWWANEQAPSRFSINMKGKHQADNAAVAQMVLRLLYEQGMNLKEEAVQRGLASSVLPGRFEIIHSQPVIVLDSAHNVAGMKAFLATLNQEFPGYRKVLLFAGFKDKQLQEMLQVTEKYVDEVVLTTFDHPRAASVQILEEIAQHIPRKVVLDWKKTVTSMMAEEKTGNTVFCITGSLHFITEIRRFIQNEKSQKL